MWLSRCVLRAVVIAALVVTAFNTGCGANHGEDALIAAVRAPYVAFWRGDALGLCNAFTPNVAATLALRAKNEGQCVKRVGEILGEVPPSRRVPRPISTTKLEVNNVKVDGPYAVVSLVYLGGGQRRLSLIKMEYVGGVWRVATRAVVGVTGGCPGGPSQRRCVQVLKSAVLVVGTFGLSSTRLEAGVLASVALPTSTRDRAMVKYGSKVFVESGCLACHRIGLAGSAAPGPQLTTVGLRLSEGQIAKSIIEASAPMPSFSNIGKKKLAALVMFLSRLRG
jgi:mono/diheme cytochrome c family protein